MQRLVLPREARFTLAAFGRVQRDDVVARLHAGDARPDLADDARAFMAEDRGEDALAVEPVERVGVGVADAGRHDLDQHFAGLRALRGRARRSRAASWLRRRRRRGSSWLSPGLAPMLRKSPDPVRRRAHCRSARRARRSRRPGRARGRSASRSAPWRRPARIPDGTGRRSPAGRSRRAPAKGVKSDAATTSVFGGWTTTWSWCDAGTAIRCASSIHGSARTTSIMVQARAPALGRFDRPGRRAPRPST